MLKMANENRESALLDRALYHHRTNTFLLCLAGLYVQARNQSLVPGSRVLFLEPVVRRKWPHITLMTLVTNAILFQSVSIYGVVINRDLTRAGALEDFINVGQGLQLAALGAFVLCAL